MEVLSMAGRDHLLMSSRIEDLERRLAELLDMLRRR